MSLLDPARRARLGAQQQTELLGTPAREAGTLLDSSWRDFVFAEVWTRPGLDRRSRYFIAICAAVCQGGRQDVVDGYVRGALRLGEISLAELREAALHLAIYAGWSRRRSSRYRRDPCRRRDAPRAGRLPAHQGQTLGSRAAADGGGGELRLGHDFPSASAGNSLLRGWNSHAAMASGNATVEEMQEFVLQYAVDGSWPKASVMQSVVLEMGERVTKGLPYQ